MEKHVRVEDLTTHELEAYLLPLKKTEEEVSLPQKFTFPFYYEPHPLALDAVEAIMPVIQSISSNIYDFDLENNGTGMGKMFGVLVVQKQNGELGFLAAFSGKVGSLSHFKPFVPPIFNRLTKNSFYLQGEKKLNALNAEIEALEQNPELAEKQKLVEAAQKDLTTFKAESKQILKESKKKRDDKRKHGAQTLSVESYNILKEELAHESIARQLKVKYKTAELQEKVNAAKQNLQVSLSRLNTLKEERKQLSGKLQQALFESYLFRNAKNEQQHVAQIFSDFSGIMPPAGAGECAAPKLLNFAYIAGWKPICMAEFWYGRSPAAEIRKHLHFYPACRSKCEPILGFMLQGLKVDDNPIIQPSKKKLELPILYEDDALIIVNKPSGLLSVPGKEKPDSVYDRILQRYPNLTGPVIVHRLDMDTSGIMMLAKTKEDHKHLQSQFINRTIKKRYIAELEGKITESEGNIQLPLRVDLDNRPSQMVCYEYGKPAYTQYKVISKSVKTTRVYFYPHTGRTHQLRMHAAHKDGLNSPIVGDDLYGRKGTRLHLHAERIQFIHPRTKKRMKITCSPDF